jgi:GTPase SAR1 family protein
VETEEDKINKQINDELRVTKKKQDMTIKLLLLGAGESGKSTIAKQIRLIHREEFTPEERAYYKNIIHSNAFTCLKAILTGGVSLGISVKDQNLSEMAESIVSSTYMWDGKLTSEIAGHLEQLWADPGVKEMYSKSYEYQLPDCAEYYLSDIHRIAESSYSPTDDDIIRSRVKTTGVIETKFDVEGNTFILVDVGGQRSERRKWVLCFEDVTAVIFCIAMSEYNLKCYEDNTTNRIHESIRLFSEIVNSKWFLETPLILFLNKSDLLQQKVDEGVSLNIAFPDYDGEHDFESYVDYITLKFTDTINNKSKKQSIYKHVTNATNTNSIEVVWLAVSDIVLQQALDNAGLAI